MTQNGTIKYPQDSRKRKREDAMRDCKSPYQDWEEIPFKRILAQSGKVYQII